MVGNDLFVAVALVVLSVGVIDIGMAFVMRATRESTDD